ncbi:hypothetical protein OAM67_01775, partial [bacterium]|nr:hypothetical protein [bacterium]
ARVTRVRLPFISFFLVPSSMSTFACKQPSRWVTTVASKAMTTLDHFTTEDLCTWVYEHLRLKGSETVKRAVRGGVQHFVRHKVLAPSSSGTTHSPTFAVTDTGAKCAHRDDQPVGSRLSTTPQWAVDFVWSEIRQVVNNDEVCMSTPDLYMHATQFIQSERLYDAQLQKLVCRMQKNEELCQVDGTFRLTLVGKERVANVLQADKDKVRVDRVARDLRGMKRRERRRAAQNLTKVLEVFSKAGTEYVNVEVLVKVRGSSASMLQKLVRRGWLKFYMEQEKTTVVRKYALTPAGIEAGTKVVTSKSKASKRKARGEAVDSGAAGGAAGAVAKIVNL